MRRFLSTLFLCLLLACANDATPISREDAIQRAQSIATINMPELEATSVPLTNVRVELLTLSDASTRIWGAGSLSQGQDPRHPVWLVSMEGEWHNAFPAPTGTVAQQPALRHFAVIVDAITGDLMGSSITP